VVTCASVLNELNSRLILPLSQVAVPRLPEEGKSRAGHGSLRYMNSECPIDTATEVPFPTNYANVEIYTGRQGSVNPKPPPLPSLPFFNSTQESMRNYLHRLERILL
jgi:hypothetical protein